MNGNWHRKLYEWAWMAGEKCYVGKMQTKPFWKKHCRKITRQKQKKESNEIGCNIRPDGMP